MRKLGKCEKRILEALKGNRKMTELEIRKRIGRQSPIYAALNRLLDEGVIQRKRNKDTRYIYRYSKIQNKGKKIEKTG